MQDMTLFLEDNKRLFVDAKFQKHVEKRRFSTKQFGHAHYS